MSDILIRGMEMPKDGVYWCEIGIAGEIATITIHGEDRKSFLLLPLPDGHGPLIDADALYEIAKTMSMGIYGPCDYQCVITGNDILKAPIIVPAEVGGRE